MRVLVGVTGSIAAFRACELVLALRKSGDEVRVVMTDSAARFITPLTLETLAGSRAASSLWDPSHETGVEHIELAQWPEAIVVAPATANFIGKLAAGIADDLLTTVVMASLPETPVFLAPAMNTKMWNNPVVQRNVNSVLALDSRYRVIAPRISLLACGDYGEGALAELGDILAALGRSHPA